MVMMWSAPATDNILATSLALIGARDLSFLSCLRSGSGSGIRSRSRSRSRSSSPGVGIDWNDSSNSLCRRDLAGVDHDEKLHEVVIYLRSRE